METPAPGVDVNPVTQDLERRLQQRSVLYLIGPQRMLDRVRQAPGLLVRLPRAAWDYVMRGELSRGLLPANDNTPREVPDFKMILSDQFSVLQSRIDDLLRTSPSARKWIAAGGKAYDEARLSPDVAGNIAEEELAELKSWLEKRWNATPRDTRALQSLLKYLPGGNKLTAVAESAPYLLVIGLIAHHALFGTDLLVLGGYTIATWLTERLSNEVAARTRTANMRIADRFTRLAHEQIQKMCTWIDQQAVPSRMLERIDRAANELATAANQKQTTTQNAGCSTWVISSFTMSPALEQLVREAMDVTGSARPDLLEDDSPVLADDALKENDGDFYLIGLIGGKDVGKSALINALVGKPITAVTSHGAGTEIVVAYAHASQETALRKLLEREVPGEFRIVKHDLDPLRRQVLLDLPDIDSKYAYRILAVMHDASADAISGLGKQHRKVCRPAAAGHARAGRRVKYAGQFRLFSDQGRPT